MKSRRYIPLIICMNVLLLISATCAYSLIHFSQRNKTNAVANLQTEDQLRQIARSITVKAHAGNSRGSGILIGKKGHLYTVVTNAHVVNRGTPYRVTTPDGKSHTAFLKSKGDSWTGNDLAILEFQAPDDYTIATLGDSSAAVKDEKVFAAGFPHESEQFTFSGGIISLIAEKPLVGGYQIGFNNPTQQGMSGGPLLDEKGEVIGILGQGNIAILDDVYTYQDGSRPDESTLEQMKASSFAVPIALLKYESIRSQTDESNPNTALALCILILLPPMKRAIIS